jgi:hypothetical protein
MMQQNDTVKTVKTCIDLEVTSKSETKEEEVHYNRVAALTGIEAGDNVSTKLLKNVGFRYFVTDSIFSRFKYTAGIKGSYSRKKFGDLPLIFAFVTPIVASVVLASLYDPYYLFGLFMAVLAPALTMNYFPSEEIIDYIGDVPDFILDRLDKIRELELPGSADKKITIHSNNKLQTIRFAKIDPVLVYWITDNLGVVVGVWDNDKELEIL